MVVQVGSFLRRLAIILLSKGRLQNSLAADPIFSRSNLAAASGYEF